MAGQGLLQCLPRQHVVLLRLLIRLSYVLLPLAVGLQIPLHVRHDCVYSRSFITITNPVNVGYATVTTALSCTISESHVE